MENQAHNNLWAEKLLQVSMPDSGEAWADMEAVLDRKMPQHFWRDRRRWLLLILLLLLLIGVCNCPGRGRLFHGSGTTRARITRTSYLPHTSHKRKGTASHHIRRPAAAPATPAAFGDIAQTVPDDDPPARTPHRKPPPAESTGTGKNGTSAGQDTATATKKNAPSLPAPTPRKDSLHKKKSPPPEEPKKKDHGWMIAAGLNQFFPIGGQQGSTFNSNGLTGTLSDYLPVPMVRYYINPRLYVQLEAQFNTPQATKKNLVISSPTPDTFYRPGNTIVSTASLRQLYYFNVPLSVHFQPWNNVNIGTGLQFSHLSNAIGDFDSTITNIATSNVENSKATKSFKGDSLYQHIKTNEFRFLLDVSYTYKHFILGLRYNQALSNFVNVQLATGQVTQSRNSSLQLYLRYIIFDSRKKTSPPK